MLDLAPQCSEPLLLVGDALGLEGENLVFGLRLQRQLRDDRTQCKNIFRRRRGVYQDGQNYTPIRLLMREKYPLNYGY